MKIRTFEVWYPEMEKVGLVKVEVEMHETPEKAILREGDTIGEWIFLGEVF